MGKVHSYGLRGPGERLLHLPLRLLLFSVAHDLQSRSLIQTEALP